MRRKKKEIIEWGSVKLRVVEQERCDACYWNTADGCKSPPCARGRVARRRKSSRMKRKTSRKKTTTSNNVKPDNRATPG